MPHRFARRFTRSAAAVCVAGFALAAPEAHAIKVRHDVPIDSYNALGNQAHMNAVCYVVAGNMACTGTLVSPTQILTAAHCLVTPDGATIDPNEMYVRFYVNGVLQAPVRVTRADVHPDWDESRNKHTDIALLELERPIEGITPLPVTSADPLERLGTIVGFGAQGTGQSAQNLQRMPGASRRLAAHNTLDVVRNECCNAGNVVIRLDFDDPDRSKRNRTGSGQALSLEGGASFGDSGGPALARFGTQDFVVGVASYITGQGRPAPSAYGDVSGYQAIGSLTVTTWLELMGVEVIQNPFAVVVPPQLTEEDLPMGPDGTPAPFPPASPMGGSPDVDADNTITPRDLAEMLRGLRGGVPASDVNADGQFDSRDAARMLEALGVSTASFPKKRQWRRAVRDLFRNQVEPLLSDLKRKDRRAAWRVLRNAYGL